MKLTLHKHAHKFHADPHDVLNFIELLTKVNDILINVFNVLPKVFAFI